MSQSPMISVPLKRTDEVDWVSPLRRYIAVSYQDDPEKYAEETGTIHRLRQDMRGAGNDITGRDVLYRYFGQLEILDLRFPVDEAHIKIGFLWYDAFTQRPTSQFSLAFEKASTIFNIASVLSAIATSQTRINEPEGVKKAFHFYQAAAGIYTYINENFLHAPSIDLSRDTVKMLVTLMLAQAQEVFWEKTLAEKKKPLLISKLAAQVTWGYQTALEAMADGISKQVFEKNWQTLCQIKAKLFAAIAQYYRSLAAESESKWGEMVSRMQIAETAIKDAEKQAKQFASGFTQSSHPTVTLTQESANAIHEITKSHLAIISEKKAQALKDNDMIYHEAVPSEGSLAPMEKLNATKPLPISELYTQSEMQKVIGPDTFQRLIPLSVHESSSLYSEEKAKLVRAEAEKCETANHELSSALEFMNLPAGLDKFKNEANGGRHVTLDSLAVPPASVKECADFIHLEEAGGDSIADLITALDKAKSGSKGSLENANLLLDEERSQCEAMRAKYADLWTQRPSGPLTQVFRADSKALLESIEKAAASDLNLYRSFDQIASNVMVLRDGRDGAALEQLFARIVVETTKNRKGSSRADNNSLLDVEDSGESEAVLRTVAKVEEVIAKLKKLKQERMDTFDDLKMKTQQDDISNLLILNKKSSGIEPQLFAQELEKFRPHQTRMTATIHHQQVLMQELTAHYKELMNRQEARSLQEVWDATERKRQALAEQLLKTRPTYITIKDGYRKGIRFYEDLNVQVQDLARAVGQFCSSRKDERGMLERQVMTLQSERESKALKDQLSKLGSVSSPPMNPLPIDALANLNLGSARGSAPPVTPPVAPSIASPVAPMVPQWPGASAPAPSVPYAPVQASAPYFPQQSSVSAPSAPLSYSQPSVATPLQVTPQQTPQQTHSMIIPNTGPFALPTSPAPAQPIQQQQPLQRQASYTLPSPVPQQQQPPMQQPPMQQQPMQQQPYVLQQQFSQPQLQAPPQQQQQQQPYQATPASQGYQVQPQFQQQQSPTPTSPYQPITPQGQYQQPIQPQFQQAQPSGQLAYQPNLQQQSQQQQQQFQQPVHQQSFHQQQPQQQQSPMQVQQFQQPQQQQQQQYMQQQPMYQQQQRPPVQQQQIQSPVQYQQPVYNTYSAPGAPQPQYQQQQQQQQQPMVQGQYQPQQQMQQPLYQQQPLQQQQQQQQPYQGGYQQPLQQQPLQQQQQQQPLQQQQFQQQQQQQFAQGGYAPLQPTQYRPPSLLD